MKRLYISPEFNVTEVSGTYNMKSMKTFMGSNIMDIEDEILIEKDDILYYQDDNNEQISFQKEVLNTPVSFNVSEMKQKYSELSMEEQDAFTKENNTRWLLKIDVKSLLIDCIFAKIKNARSFEGVKNINTKYNDVDISIKEYIKENILDRYELSDIILYTRYNSLESNDSYRYTNNWDSTISKSDIESKIFVDKTDLSKVLVRFAQSKNSKDYSFNYYYDVRFKRI